MRISIKIIDTEKKINKWIERRGDAIELYEQIEKTRNKNESEENSKVG